MRCQIFSLACLLAMAFGIPSHSFAQEKVSAQDRVISSTFKTLAKGFVAVADMDKLKSVNIKKIEKMDTNKFNKRYAKVYEIIKGLPESLKSAYGITENITQEQAAASIRSLDKDKIYKDIDSIPDAFIAGKFKRYINEKKQALQDSNLAAQINNLWTKMVRRSYGEPSTNPR